ncbi:amino acid/amide ABC transporter substrate-binding protein, HAAT family [Rhizobiales bacterium GAS191]|nr:amino acid/amide ABC transporter substrate-binding protein, HAAT family [Rhizobiales bacterium GAS113]SED33973.1 amino acid/amide ABC transporter substrate-binding protein, HAAT family [Rhizobiales bacterium GAS188]SEE96099.1 amino acid/amide ABC transporter substrate-binding protein, HAAT family [Rhizobiales bacterium GAS191]
MRRILAGSVFAAAMTIGFLALGVQAEAQDKLKIGVVLSLSGPPAALGKQSLDGFQLAVKTLGGKLGGRDAEMVIVDDELKPDLAITKVQALIDRDKVDFVVGPIFSNVLAAIMKPVTDSKTFLISPNAGPSSFAGKACNPYFFVTSYENDRIHAVSGTYAQEKGYKRVFLLAPNYQAGKDAVEGFKSAFKGEIADEVYTPLTQLDFSAELAKIAAAKPDALYVFMPGGLGVNLVKQYRQAGLGDIPFLSAFTVDESTLPAQQDAAVGFYGGSNWAPNLDTPQNKAFVAAFEKAYNYVPGSYAFEAYDAALLIDSVLKATGGKTNDKEALRAALKKADFQSLRGGFKFNNNGYPIQNFYLTKVAKRPDGKFETEIVQTVFKDDVDPHGKECPLK